jgi:predicted amidophosphoribosyltransferase
VLCARLKSADPDWLPAYAGQVLQQTMRDDALASLFEQDSILVPVPSSQPFAPRVWAAERLATVLRDIGLGNTVWRALQRRFPVRKSATALNTDRPTVQQHYNSLAIAPVGQPSRPGRIVLIDDVITKGRTILAAAIRLHEAFPNADIRAFALVRTMGFLPDVTDAVDVCQGVVRWAGRDARREP